MKKCQHCEKPATFHITELTDPSGPVILHLCEEHARIYLAQNKDGDESPSGVVNEVAKHLKMDQTASELATLDKQTCPVCGISFAEFRKAGRFGCAYDYVCFQEDLELLISNIHGAKIHTGKHPTRNTGSPDLQHDLIQLRREMQDAVHQEDYEKAGELRDRIRSIESGNGDSEPDASDSEEDE